MKRFFEEYGAVCLAAIATAIIIGIIVVVGGHVQTGTGGIFDSLVNSHNDVENSVVYRVEYNSSTGKELSVGSVTGVMGSTKEVKPIAKVGYTSPESQMITWDADTKTIEFIYTPIDYRISYDLQGGTKNDNPTTYNIESAEIELKAPLREGHNFTGWTSSDLTQPKLEVTIPTGSTGDKQFTANWLVQSYKYNIVYESTSGKNLGSDTITKEYGTTNNIVPPEKQGYTTPKAQDIIWDTTAPKTIKFVYTPIEYTINYSLDGGTLGSSPVTKYTVETANITLPSPTKTGHTFTGWTGSNGSKPEKNVTIPTGSMGEKNFTANWVANKYTLTFDVNGGNAIAEKSREVTFGQPLGKLPTPTRLEHEFLGWYTQPTGGSQVTENSTMIAANQTLYARWGLNQYTVYFNGNGGTDGTPITQYYGQKLGNLPTSSRTGYTFQGWFTTPTGGEKITSETLMPSGGATYYAHWTANQVGYKVVHETMDVDGINYSHLDTDTYPAKTGEVVSPEPKNLIGFTSPEKQTVTVDGTGQTTITYRYTRNTYQFATENVPGFTYDPSTSANGEYYYGKTLNVNGDANPGYLFVQYDISHPFTKWDDYFYEGNKNVKFPMPALNNSLDTFTVTPRVALQRYSISYDLDGGFVDTKNPASYDIETETFTLNKPQKAGYTFVGWTGSNGDTPQKEVTIQKGTSGALSYKANWQINDYTLFFDANGGTVTPTSKKITYNQPYGELPTPVLEGHEFLGWYTRSDGGDKVSESTVMLNNDTTIYAHWLTEENTITINYVYEDGSEAAKSISETVKFGVDYSYTSPVIVGYQADKTVVEGRMGVNPVVETVTYSPKQLTYKVIHKSSTGKVFEEQDLQGTFGDSMEFAPVERKGYVTPASQTVVFDSETPKTITFTYNIINYNLNYSLEGGTLPSDAITSYNVEAGKVVLPTPTKLGFGFVGWADSSSAVKRDDLKFSSNSCSATSKEFSLDKETIVTLTVANYAERFGIVEIVDLSTNKYVLEISSSTTKSITLPAGNYKISAYLGSCSDAGTIYVTDVTMMETTNTIKEFDASNKTGDLSLTAVYKELTGTLKPGASWLDGASMSIDELRDMVEVVNFTSQSPLAEGGPSGSTVELGDISAEQNGSIKAYFDNNSATLTVYSNTPIKFAEDSSAMFKDFVNLRGVWTPNIDLTNVKNMSSMFENAGSEAYSFKATDLSNWDVSSVTTFERMFLNTASSVDSFTLDLSNWNIGNAKTIKSMFTNAGANASTWSVGDLSNWNTSNVEQTAWMFAMTGKNATNWTVGNLSNWDLSKVFNTTAMFKDAGINATNNIESELTIVNNYTSVDEMFTGAFNKISDKFYVRWANDSAKAKAVEAAATNTVGTDGIDRVIALPINGYELHLNLDGGKLSGETPTYYVSGVETKLPTPTKNGHSFLGWAEVESHNLTEKESKDNSIQPFAGENTTNTIIESQPLEGGNFTYNCIADVRPVCSHKDYHNKYEGKVFNDPATASLNKLEAVPNKGYRFVGWFNRSTNELISNENPYNSEFDYSDGLIAKFEKLPLISSIPADATGDKAYIAVYEKAITYELVDGPTFNGKFDKNTVNKFIFTDEVAPSGATLIDVDADGNGGVVAWVDGTTVYVSTQKVGQKVIANTNAANMFAEYLKVSYVDVANLDVSNVTDMSNMFFKLGENSSTLEIKGLQDWDTSNVTNMRGLFRYTGKTSSTWNIGDLSNWDVSNVTDMAFMFDYVGQNVSTWSIGDLSNWNTSKVTNMSYMFSRAWANSTVWNVGDISNWNTSKVVNMREMFNYAGYKAQTFSLNLSNWDTSKVINMYLMFNYAGYNAKEFKLDLSNWNVSEVTNMKEMFSNAGYSATDWSIGDLSNWNTGKVTDMSGMFKEAGRSTKNWNIGNLSNWNTSSVTDMNYMFASSGYNSVSWDIGDLGRWDVSNVTNMSYMFSKAGYNSTTWNFGNLSSWNTSKVTNMSSIFNSSARNLKDFTLDLSGWNVDKVTNMGYMLYGIGANKILTPKSIKPTINLVRITSKTWYDTTDGNKEYPAGTFPVGFNESHTLVNEKPAVEANTITFDLQGFSGSPLHYGTTEFPTEYDPTKTTSLPLLYDYKNSSGSIGYFKGYSVNGSKDLVFELQANKYSGPLTITAMFDTDVTPDINIQPPNTSFVQHGDSVSDYVTFRNDTDYLVANIEVYFNGNDGTFILSNTESFIDYILPGESKELMISGNVEYPGWGDGMSNAQATFTLEVRNNSETEFTYNDSAQVFHIADVMIDCSINSGHGACMTYCQMNPTMPGCEWYLQEQCQMNPTMPGCEMYLDQYCQMNAWDSVCQNWCMMNPWVSGCEMWNPMSVSLDDGSEACVGSTVKPRTESQIEAVDLSKVSSLETKEIKAD